VAFKGDASQISLTNIFQTLQLNGQEGVMTVSSGKVRRKVRLIPGGVRLLALNRDNPDVLRLVLVKQKIVTDSQFQNIISTMGQPALFPGEFLIQRRILTPAQVENEVQKQLRELIYEIFSWKKAKYEFMTGDPGDELELFNPEGLGQSLSFNINSVLMEAARRDDDWQRIRAELPSERQIFIPVDRAAFLRPRAYETEIGDQSIQEVKRLIDGEHTIEAVVNESTLSEFEVFRTMVLFLKGGEIRPLNARELKDLAEELRKKFKSTEVIEIYRHLLESEPADVDVRLKLVQLLEKNDKKKEGSGLLQEQFQALAEHHYQLQDHNTALTYLKRVLETDAHHLFALDKLFDILYLQKNHKEAVETARRLVEAIKAKKEFERGAEILLKVVDLYPTETFLFHELADFYIFSNQGDNAVMCLKSVASVYEDRRDLTRLRKTYERIASIDPSEAATLRKIVDAERKTQKSGRPFLSPPRSWTWVMAAALLVLVASYFLIMEVLGRHAYASVQGDVRSCARAGDFKKARAILEDLGRRYPLSSLPNRISEDLGSLLSEERERDAERRKNEEKENLQFGSCLARLESLMSGKRYVEALALVREASRAPLAEGNRKKLAAMEGEIQKYFGAADELLRQARELLQGGKHEEAHKLFLQLMMNYPSTPASQGLKLPLLVKSTPPGARVTLNGEPAGSTPFILYYDPLARFSLTVQKEGFRSITLDDAGQRRAIDFTKDSMVAVRLERIPAWIFDAQAPVECTALVIENRVYFGTRGGRIFCLDRETGTPRWSYRVPDGWDVASGLRAFRDRVCFGTFDGAFHVLEARTGRPLHRLVPLSPARPIRHPASEARDSGTVAVNCGGAGVAGVNTVSGSLLWLFRADADVLGPPELYRDSFIAATSDGVLHLLDPANGTESRRLPLGSRLQSQGKALDGTYLVGDASGRIRRIDLETGVIQWTYESPMEELTAPAIGGELVFFGSRGGLLAALELKSGDLKWRGKVNDGLLSPATWHHGSFYLGTKAGQGLCLDGSTGASLWSFAAGGPCGSSPGSGGELVIFASDDHRVYAFAEN
jgi:outer membrane protein assembly factor BamB/tetratricopeptide (TPR) repeat protein